MNILKLFDHSEEKKLAHDLATRLIKELPPELMRNRRHSLSVNKITRILENTYAVAKEHQRERHIGFVKRAILINKFKWELNGQQYPDDFIDVATEGLLMELAKASSGK